MTRINMLTLNSDIELADSLIIWDAANSRTRRVLFQSIVDVIEQKTIQSGAVVNNNLILTRGDGSTIDCGQVT